MRLTKTKLARLQANVLQIDLARRADINRARLSEIENGHCRPRPEELRRIANVLGIPEAEVCGEHPAPPAIEDTDD